ncbi:MAG: ABC transporter ATP-binding protein [Candidatus Nomurabacteria bacterium]
MTSVNNQNLTNIKKLGLFDRFMFWLLRIKPLVISEKKLGSAGIKVVLKLYAQSFHEFRWVIFFSIVVAITASLSNVVVPYIFKQFLDMLGKGAGVVPVTSLYHTMWIFFGFAFLAWAGWRTCYIVNSYFASRMLAILRQRSFSYLIGHSHQFFIDTFAGSLVQKVNRFAQSYDKLADRILYDIIPIIVQVSFVIYILLKERPALAVVILVWLFVFVVWNYIFAKWKLKYDTSRAEQDSFSSATLADAVSNHQTIELYKSQKVEEKRYEDVTNLQSYYARFSWQSASVIDGIQGLLIVFVEVAMLYVGIDLWSKGLMTIGLFVLVQTYVLQLADRLWSLSRVIRDVYEAFADAKEMAEIMTLPHAIQEKKNAKVLKNVEGEVTFCDTTFAFNGKNVIDHINLTIKKGEKVALVGVSGAGKSTLIKLLFRQYDPDSGMICIDGQNIKGLTLMSLRNALSLVPQDPALFHRSLMENIRYGKQSATDEEVKEAAILAHCDDFISELPLGYETLVGERGIKLSGGERQRVAIARAFLRNSPILVLDEATSSLDSHSEEKVQDSLMKLMENKTTIVIAHRLSTIRRVDRILVLKDGVVAEDGTHDELLENKEGIYAKLWDIQQGGFLKDEEDADIKDEK